MFQVSQWELVESWYAWVLYPVHIGLTWIFALGILILVALFIPCPLALIEPLMSSLTAVMLQQDSTLMRWKRYATGAGAIVELLVCPIIFYYFWAWQNTYIGPGFVLLMLGSLVLLVGDVKQNVSTNQRENSTFS